MGLDVVGLGYCSLDYLLRIPRVPDFEEGAQVSDFAVDGGGPVATAMVALARLGAKVGYVGKFGNDEVGRLKRKQLQQEGVDVSQVILVEGDISSLFFVLIEERTGRRGFLGYYGTEGELRPEELDREYITSAPFVHLDGRHATAALQAAEWMHEAGGQVALDAGGGKRTRPISPQMEALVRATDVLIAAQGFAVALTGRDDLPEAGRALLDYGPHIVAITAGEAGSWCVSSEVCFHAPAFSVEVVDTTGAGDVYHGAFIYGLLQGWDLRRVATFANAVAALKCRKMGGRTGIPTLREAEQFLASHVPDGRSMS